MKRNIRVFVITCGLLFVGIAAHAEITPTIITLIPSYGTTYQVPTGKVLVIRAITASGASANSAVALNMTGQVFFAEMLITRGQTQTFCSPLQIPGGTILYVNTGHYIFIYGSLVDPSDLYAAIPSSIEDMALANGSISGTAKIQSPRPVAFTMQYSTNLAMWNQTTASIARISSASQYSFGLPAEDVQSVFLRADARARP